MFSSFISTFENIFGQYSPIVDSVTGQSLTDWGYVSRVAVFLVAFYSVFRIIGILFERGGRR